MRYTGTAIVLHWILAVAIATIFVVGLRIETMPFSPAKLQMINWHKWAGISILALSAFRLVWRLTHRPPALPMHIGQSMPTWQRRGYQAVHLLMYVLFFVVPLLGWAYSAARGFPVVWFGVLPLPDLVEADPARAELLGSLHSLSAIALMGLVAVHVGAALEHQFIHRADLLARMWPDFSKTKT